MQFLFLTCFLMVSGHLVALDDPLFMLPLNPLLVVPATSLVHHKLLILLSEVFQSLSAGLSILPRLIIRMLIPLTKVFDDFPLLRVAPFLIH